MNYGAPQNAFQRMMAPQDWRSARLIPALRGTLPNDQPADKSAIDAGQQGYGVDTARTALLSCLHLPTRGGADMVSRLLIAKFLEAHPEFNFDLLEHIEASQVIFDARATFDEACRADEGLGDVCTLWKSRRDDIRAAVEGIPAYSAIDWTLDKFQDCLPFIDKSHLRTNPDQFLSPRFDRAKLWSRETSGTSGPPVTLFYAPDFFAGFQYFSACKVAFRAGLLTPSVLERPICCLMVLDNRYLRDRVWLDPSGYSGMTLRVVIDEGDAKAADRLLDLVIRHNPAILSLGPSTLSAVIAQLGKRARILADYLVLIISGGSNLDDTLRIIVDETTGVPVINAYGMTEIGEIASDCSLHRGLHVQEATIIAEVMDDNGRLASTGHGELVVSSIMNRAMPLLRYKTGDRVEIIDEPCRCGRSGRRINSLIGRQVRPFRFADGSFYSPTHLNVLFRRFPVREFQVTQQSIQKLVVGVEFFDGTLDRTACLRAIHLEVTASVKALIDVEVIEEQFAANSKFQRYRSEADASGIF
ncbi:hypothetical protein MOV61_06615 [Neorhizobium sp. BETTINA12A]|uniref:phenylacetate--CoA ligase family protein n=1 Tax=Neorhizobium sp. BETTINA12A TaxID=2908924 RepID=UPI001FF36CD3|nr:AMP-binding protein [Neorhizobium sp. BETTINA12A]MCJ9750391.1 hypothetical protein [Neorhizobium sp. BETTINA12A]